MFLLQQVKQNVIITNKNGKYKLQIQQILLPFSLVTITFRFTCCEINIWLDYTSSKNYEQGCKFQKWHSWVMALLILTRYISF